MSADIRRGQVYYADLDPVIGHEQAGHRPVLVIQNDVGNQFSNTVIIAALTSRLTDKLYPSEVRLPEGTAGLARASAVRLDQIRTVDKRRLGRLVGRLDTHYMRQVDKAIKISLGLSD